MTLFTLLMIDKFSIIDDSVIDESRIKAGRKKSDVSKNPRLHKKHHPNVKIMSTKGLFSEGFQSELNIDSKPEMSQSRSVRRTTRNAAQNDQIKQEQTAQPNNIALIEEPKELANIIQEFGEYFPVALPLTTKLDAIIHENDTNDDIEDDKSSFKNESDSKTSSNSKCSDCFSLMMDNSSQTPSRDNYFLFQIPASYSTIANKDKEMEPVVDKVPEQNMNAEDNFDFNGRNIEHSYFTNGNDPANSINGFLELTESGQVRLRIGNDTYTVDDAMKNCFLQELYVTESDPSIDEDPIIAKVGQISNKFICSWNFENDEH